ncbi:MAG: ATP-binding cassette domain-containing protein [Desulfobulbaceae bacterium]|nr:MAG: ATP-binding cassette domain-containing protein [Desulfobulbaceae bacterium]
MADTDITKRSLFYWVYNRYRGLQVLLLVIIVVSLFFRVFPLEMQRRIINVAINLKMIDKLYLYCVLYMGAVLIAGLLKYLTNTMQMMIGQKILIGMRKELYQHILQLPLPFFHRTQTGTIISALTAELTAIATFLGGALAVPITSILTFFTFLGFMIYLNPLLGLLTMLIYPFEMAVIPLLQRWYNKYNRKRVATTRTLASVVNESVTGIHEVQGNASYILEQGKLDRLVKKIYSLMTKLFIFKYGIKFSNNLFQSIGPFLLFLIGGYMAIHGEFTIGALVAFLSAYEKVYDPWKEVIEYYQSYQDARVRYKQIMTLFAYQPEFLLEPLEKREVFNLKGEISATNLNYWVNDSVQLLQDISFQIKPGNHVALVGFSGSGKSTLSLLLSQLYRISSGSLKIDNHEISDLTKRDLARNVANVAQHPFIFTGTVRDNLLYASNTLQKDGLIEAIPSPQEQMEMIREVGLEEDTLRWGLRSVIPLEKAAQMRESFLKMREVIHHELRNEFTQAIEFYDAHTFLHHQPIATNLIFGTYGGAYHVDKFITNQQFRSFLSTTGLEKKLLDLGLIIARSTIEFLGDFRADEYFFQGSPMSQARFDHYEALVKRAAKIEFDQLKSKELESFLQLALDFTPGIHKIHTLNKQFEDDILRGRSQFLKQVADIDLDECRDGAIQTAILPISDIEKQARTTTSYTPFCFNQYLFNRTLRDNILFGTVINQELIREKLGTLALEVFKKHGLLDDIMEIGLDFHVGSKGDNLSGGQKQKLALARAFLKHAPILIMDEATASLDNRSQARIQNYIETRLRGNTTVIAVVHRLDMISGYDHIIVMKDGKIVEAGNYQNLIEQQGVLYGLVNDS